MAYLPLLILALLHGVVDCYATMLPPMWRPLESTFALQGMMGFVMAGIQIPASFGQAVFGILADRFSTRWLTIAGALMAALGLGLAGLSPDRYTAIALLTLSAAGIGLFHPEAVTLANRVVPRGHPRAIGLFLGCGFLGQAIGPVWISYVIDPAQGRSIVDTWRTLPIGLAIVAVAALAMVLLPSGRHGDTGRGARAAPDPGGRRRRALQLLVAMSVTKSMGIMMLLYALTQILTVQRTIGWWMGIYIGAQGVGILVGGWTTGERRQRFMLVASLMAGLAVVVLLIPAAGTSWLELGLLSLFGLAVSWTIPTTIQLGQAIAPGRERLVGGLMIGFSWGSAMVITAPLADWIGNWPALAYACAAVFTAISLGCALCLPSQASLTRFKRRARAA